MQLAEALQATPTVQFGMSARSVSRVDRSGKKWFLVHVRERYILVREDRRGHKEVSHEFAAKWADWKPQSEEDARQEADVLNTPKGFAFRNSIFGIIFGKLREPLKAPDNFPEDLF